MSEASNPFNPTANADSSNTDATTVLIRAIDMNAAEGSRELWLPFGQLSTAVGVDLSIPATFVSADTDWGSPASAGDKSAVLADFVSLFDGTMATAFDGVSSGAGAAVQGIQSQVASLTSKFQALETALALFKVPGPSA